MAEVRSHVEEGIDRRGRCSVCGLTDGGAPGLEQEHDDGADDQRGISDWFWGRGSVGPAHAGGHTLRLGKWRSRSTETRPRLRWGPARFLSSRS